MSTQRLARPILVAGIVLLGLGLAWSTAMTSIGEVLLLIAAVLDWRQTLAARPWREPVMAVGLVLLAFIAARTLAADHTMAAWHRINQYQELVLAPLALAVLREPRHRRVLYACFITGCVYLMLWLWASHASEHAYEIAQRQRISASMSLAIAAYLLLLRAPRGPRKWLNFAAAALFTFTIFFGIDGRTGQVVLLLLAACAAWVLAPRGWRVVAAVGVPALLVATALLSPGVQGRMSEMEAAWHSTKVPDEADSSGIRLQLLRITREAVREHWLRGVGYSHYQEAHRAAAQVVYAGRPDGPVFLSRFWSSLNNPHDEYVMQAVGGGIAGLALFLAWLSAGLWQARRTHSAALAGLVLAFALGCLFNSMLLDFIEGHVYVVLMGWLVAEWRGRAAQARIERILVVAPRQAGDVLLATPLVHTARSHWPQARIDVLGFEGTLGMLRGNADVNGVVEWPVGRWGSVALLRRIGRRYDLALIADAGDRAHLIGAIAARCRSGIVPARRATSWWKRLLLDHAVVAAGDPAARHVAVEKQELLAPWLPERPLARVRVPQ